MSDGDFFILSWCVLWLSVSAPMAWRVWCRWRGWARAQGIVVAAKTEHPQVLVLQGQRANERVHIELIFGDDRRQWLEGRRLEIAIDPNHPRAGLPRSGRDMAVVASFNVVPLLLAAMMTMSIRYWPGASTQVWDSRPPVSQEVPTPSQMTDPVSPDRPDAAAQALEPQGLSRERGERPQRARPPAKVAEPE